MRYPELVIGEAYIVSVNVDGTSHRTAVFEGKHDGRLTTSDGAIVDGRVGWLRFRTVKTEKHPLEQILFIETGKDVEETAAAHEARLKQKAAEKAAHEAALAEAVEYIESLGMKVSQQWAKAGDTVRIIDRDAETVDEVEVDNVTVGKIRLMVAAARRELLEIAAENRRDE